MTFQKRVYSLVEKGDHGSKANLIFDYFIILLIILSTVAIILESFAHINTTYDKALRIFNAFSVIVFTIEYILRLYVSPITNPSSTILKSVFIFIFSFFGLIDLLAILPFYLPLLFPFDLRFIRILRLLRFFRLLKLGRYSSSMILIGSVIKESRRELWLTLFVSLLVLIMAATMMYYVEGKEQPEAFPNIVATFWWATATLTTVGYGDIYPVTNIGKVLSGVIAILGIGLIALPTGIISAGFLEKIRKQKKRCPHCGKDVDD